MEKILVLRGGALGDFIVTLPALRSLRERWPRAQIELAGNSTAAQLALARGVIDAVHSQHEARWAGLYGDASLSPAFTAWLAGFDLVLSYWPDSDGALARQFPRRAGQQFLTAPAMPARAPAAAHYCEPLRRLGIEAREFFVRLVPLAGTRISPRDGDRFDPLAHARSYERERVEGSLERRATAGLDARCIAIHPGSGSPRKNWPAENWRHLIDELPGPVSLILGEAESPQWSAWYTTEHRTSELAAGDSAPCSGGRPPFGKLRAPSPSRGCLPSPTPSEQQARRPAATLQRLARCLINRPLEELVDHFAQCRLFLGHDSGISHLAAACGARCVLLFGPTEPEVWAPPAPNVRVVRCHSDLAALPVDTVRRAVAEALADQT